MAKQKDSVAPGGQPGNGAPLPAGAPSPPTEPNQVTNGPAQGAQQADPAKAKEEAEKVAAEQVQLLERLARLAPNEHLDFAGQMWANAHQTPTLLIWLRDRDTIDRAVADAVFKALQPIGAKLEVLWVMLNSRGGDLNGAYQVGRVLQSFGTKVNVVIPRMAKSAATLITLGCHEVVMHPLAELGPIDTQTRFVRDGVSRRSSTLDALRSLEYLRQYAVDSFFRAANLMMLWDDELTITGAAKPAAAVMSGIIHPIYSQIDAAQMGEHLRALDVGTAYAKRLMEVSYATKTETEREDLIKRLSEGYPAHGFIIDVDEAKNLGLAVRRTTASELHNLDWGVIFSEGKVKSIKLFRPQPNEPETK